MKCVCEKMKERILWLKNQILVRPVGWLNRKSKDDVNTRFGSLSVVDDEICKRQIPQRDR